MCFSPTASFSTAALTGLIGIVTLTRVSSIRELPLALVPLFFGLQQSIEGLLWLTLPSTPEGADPYGLVGFYLVFSQMFWPVFAPLSVWLVEPDRRRRQLMLILLAVGIAVSASLFWGLARGAHAASIIDMHIVYVTEVPSNNLVAAGYLAATGLALVLASNRVIAALGVVVLIGSGVAYLFYWEAFQSVWCFFAAASSLLLLLHFQQMRQGRGRTAS